MKKILTRHPFNLDESQILWVESTLKKMTLDEKIGQLFILVAGHNPDLDIKEITNKIQPGGFMYRPLSGKEIFEAHKIIQENSKIPAFLAANTEEGGQGIILEGTRVGSNMQVAATNEKEYAYKQGEIAGKELKAVGGNLSFAPVVDINMEWRNPIANLRSYSDEVDKVIDFSVENVIGTQKEGVAVSVKHFPGDGVDSRDQHICPTMNHLSLKEWEATFGKVYKACFDVGALTTMVGHFLVPNIVEDLGVKEDMWIPSSINKTILNKLLREKMNFNGLILTDATSMAGMTSTYKREIMVPTAIANGADVFLFARNIDEDFQFMKNGIKNGILTKERLDESVIRILATKAKLNLHIDIHIDEDNLKNISLKESQKISKEVAQKSITLVKNEDNLFPFKKHIKKIKLIPFIKPNMMGGGVEETINYIKNKFEIEGISVDVMNYDKNPMQGLIDAARTTKGTCEKYDAFIYISSVQPTSNSSSLLINWKAMVGMDAPNMIEDIPTAWISLGSPYHLFDAPMVKNFINAYSKSETTIDSLFEKIFGREQFVGISPVNTDVRYPNYKKNILFE